MIVRRKLNGFVGFSNFPQQWHQKSLRQGFTLNLMVVGESGLGKSTLINTIFEETLIRPRSHEGPREDDADVEPTVEIKPISAEFEEEGVRLRLTILDTPGFGDSINNMDSWKPIVDEIDTRYDRYLDQETAMNRTSFTDQRIHACLYFIEPTGHSLKPLDIVVMKKLHKKVNLIPVIAKADLLTDAELARFKRTILDDLEYQQIDIFKPQVYENDDQESFAETTELINSIPFAVVGSTYIVQSPDGRSVRGRAYPWGTVEIMNEDHCDFVKLRALLIRDHMEDLREQTSNKLYESYRTDRMLKNGIVQDASVFREIDPAVRQEEERAQHDRRLAKMEDEMRAVFQQKVMEKEMKLKKSEAVLFSNHKELKEELENKRQKLEAELKALQAQAQQQDDKKRKGFSLR